MTYVPHHTQKPGSRTGNEHHGGTKLPSEFTHYLKQAKVPTTDIESDGGEPLASGCEYVLLCPVFALPHYGGANNEQKAGSRMGQVKDCAGKFRKILDHAEEMEPSAYSGPDPMNRPWRRAPRVARCTAGCLLTRLSSYQDSPSHTHIA
jgi:hypothetical protein